VRWTPTRVERLIRGLPKAETHLHLDGALSPAAIKRLAVRQGYAPLARKSAAQIAALSVVDSPRSTLAEVLKAFEVVYPLLRAADAVETAAYEAAAGAARAGALYAEVRFAPALQAAPGFPPEAALDAALRGLARAEKELGIGGGIIVCLIRPFALVSREDNAAMVELAIARRGRGVVGVDLAGDEAAQPLTDYAELLARAKSAGLRLTAHAGEAPGSRDLEAALELGVDRLGHATLLADKPRLLKKVLARGVTIEVNLTSNLRTSAVAALARHPVKAWRAAGVPVAISTDDPGLFGIDLNHEYHLLAHGLGFTPEDLVAVAAQSFDALFLPEARKRALRARFEAGTRGLLDATR
jgi:adenosine deaminase